MLVASNILRFSAANFIKRVERKLGDAHISPHPVSLFNQSPTTSDQTDLRTFCSLSLNLAGDALARTLCLRANNSRAFEFYLWIVSDMCSWLTFCVCLSGLALIQINSSSTPGYRTPFKVGVLYAMRIIMRLDAFGMSLGRSLC